VLKKKKTTTEITQNFEAFSKAHHLETMCGSHGLFPDKVLTNGIFC